MTLLKFAPLALLALLAACARNNGELDSSGGVSVTRTPCPAVAIPAGTGDITLFDPPLSRDARAIDVTAVITNLRSTCSTQGEQVVAQADFDVVATRRAAADAREVVIPYFVSVIRAGNVVVSKRVSRVSVLFEAGQVRGTGRASGGSSIALSAASLPTAVQERLTKRRKADDPDASVDPLNSPDVRAAVAQASFELLVGFQLTPDQFRYNATR